MRVRCVAHSELRGKDHNTLYHREPGHSEYSPRTICWTGTASFLFGAKAVEVAVSTTYLAPEPIPQEQGLAVSRSLLFLRLPAGIARGTGTCPPYPDVVDQAPPLLDLWRSLHVCGKGYLASRKKQIRWLTSHRTISVVISPDVHRIRAQPGLSLSYRTYPLPW